MATTIPTCIVHHVSTHQKLTRDIWLNFKGSRLNRLVYAYRILNGTLTDIFRRSMVSQIIWLLFLEL